MEAKKSAFATVKKKWNQFAEKTKPARVKAGQIAGKTGHVLGIMGVWAYRLRCILLAVPVGVAAVILALRNARQLPEFVSITIPKMQDGVLVMVAQILNRNLAVLGPLAVTGVCILMIFLSRRITYPLLVSIFSLVLPIALYYMNCVFI